MLYCGLWVTTQNDFNGHAHGLSNLEYGSWQVAGKYFEIFGYVLQSLWHVFTILVRLDHAPFERWSASSSWLTEPEAVRTLLFVFF